MFAPPMFQLRRVLQLDRSESMGLRRTCGPGRAGPSGRGFGPERARPGTNRIAAPCAPGEWGKGGKGGKGGEGRM